MPRKVDLILPRIIVDEDYKFEGRKTEPKWMKGCYGTLHFIPWHGFQDIVRNAVDAIETLSDDQLNDFKQVHQAARTKVDFVNQGIRIRRGDRTSDGAKQKSSLGGADVNGERGNGNKFHPRYVSKLVEKPSGFLKNLDNLLSRSIISLLGAMYSKERVFWTSGLCSSTSMRTHFSGDDPLRDEFHIPLHMTIQSAHIETTRENPEELHLYSFEFVRPSVDLFGLKGSQMIARKKRDYHFLKSRETGDDSIEPTRMSSIYISGFSPEEVAGYFNLLFSEVSTKDISLYRRASLPVANVICQALLTKTGCSFFCDLIAGVAFKLEKDPNLNRVNVLVSGAISGSEEPGYLAAMAGLAKFCVDEAERKEHDDMLMHIRRLASLVSKATLARRDIEDPLDNHHTCAAFFDEGSAGLYRNDRTSKDETSGFSSLRKSQNRQSGKTNENDVKKLNARLQAMFESEHRGVTTVGCKGLSWTRFISKGLWCGTEVAIKGSYNGPYNRCRDSIHHLRREIKVYNLMQMKCPSLLGSAVPRMLLGKDRQHVRSPYAGMTILATEFVGKELVRDRNGILWCGDADGYEKLDREDEAAVRDAALKSLRTLHEHGFLFGDVAMRHLRAHRLDAESTSVWRAWWIDLGMCVEVRREEQRGVFEMEWRHCVSLFERDRETKSCLDRLMDMTFKPPRVKRRRICEMMGYAPAQDVTTSPVSQL